MEILVVRRPAVGCIAWLGFFFEPRPSCIDLRGVEVANLSHRKRLAGLGHPLLPTFVADHSEAVKLGVVGGCELGVVPQRMHVRALEIDKVDQQANLAVSRDCGIHGRNEMLIVFVMEFAAERKSEDAVFGSFQACNHRSWEFRFRWFVLSWRKRRKRPNKI